MNSERNSLSVIIPSYNEEQTIRDTIISIKNQKTDFKYEALVIDGGSSDNTVKIAKQYMKVLNSPKKGKVDQLNYAVKHSNGKILIFVDADTILPENYLQIVYEKFKKDKNLLACSSPIVYRNKKLISPGVIFISLMFCMTGSFLFALLSICQLMFYLLLQGRKIFPITKYYPFTLLLYLYYSLRDFFKYTELSGTNMCIRRKIFENVKGLRHIPGSKGIDTVFSDLLRKFCKNRRGYIKNIKTLTVITNPRFISSKSVVRRLKQHKKVAIYYENNIKNNKNRGVKINE